MAAVQPEPDKDEAAEVPGTETALVAAWQTERLRELGFSESQADNLVLCHVDWHDAARVVRASPSVRWAYLYLMP